MLHNDIILPSDQFHNHHYQFTIIYNYNILSQSNIVTEFGFSTT